MWRNRLFVTFGVCLSMMLPGESFAGGETSEEERAKICAKAEKRYFKLYSKLPADEDVAVVMMHKYTFCPMTITVKQGAMVRWINVDKRTSHSVWFKQSGKEESLRLFGGEQVEFTFDGAIGEHPYLCGPHWEEENMKGGVIVEP